MVNLKTAGDKPVKFLGFSGPLMIFSDSKLLIKNQGEGNTMKPGEEEKYVRAHWESPHWTYIPGYGWVVQNYSDGATFLASYLRTKKLATHAAYLFTVERKKQIARREKSIEWLGSLLADMHQTPDCAHDLLALAQADLAELLKGWRG